jgi:hypothetical protein
MHPTADTVVFMFIETLGAAGDAGRSAAQFFKSIMETCGWQRRAALSQSSARPSSIGRASDYL